MSDAGAGGAEGAGASPVTVSVVVPSRGRAEAVGRAVASALLQADVALEVIVVLDGPDPASEALLAGCPDQRLRVVVLPASVGGAQARNIGVDAARGEWIALLDDDDVWLPGKLQRQLAAAGAQARCIVACRVIARSPRGDAVWPRRLPAVGEALGDYLFDRREPFLGESLLQSTMLLAPRALFREVPFQAGLPRHQDWDWVLRATRAGAGVPVVFVPEALAIWHVEDARPTLSGSHGWEDSLAWARQVAPTLSPRAFAGLVLTVTSPFAAREGARGAFWRLLHEARAHGRPRALHLALHGAFWLVPPGLRRAIRRLRHPG